MLGNVDAGKSTMVGIMTAAPGQLDDGRGAMRANVFNYAHE
jgi:GTPase